MLKSLISNTRRQQFFNLLIFYGAFLWFRVFSGSVLGPYLLKNNVNLAQMILGSAIFYLVAGLFLTVVNVYSSRKAWFWAVLLTLVSILSLINLNSVWQYYIYAVILGVGGVLYFVPYNIAHFQLTPNHRNSFSAAIMFSIMPVISFLAPLCAGWLAQRSYSYIWCGAGIFAVITLFLVKFQTGFTFRFNLKKDLVYIKPNFYLLVIEGLWEPIVLGVISVFTLYFIDTPLAFGVYLSYLGLVAIAANLFLGHLSDKLNRRLHFLIPTTVLLGLGTMLLPFSINNLGLWIVITGLLQFLAPLFWNFSTAYFVDLQTDFKRSMPVREWVLSVSRTVGYLLVFINFYWQTRPTAIFYLLGAIMLLYPLVLLYNIRHAARS